MQINLTVNIGGLKLKNPVMVASGTFGYAEEFSDFLDLRQLGAVVSKTITINPRRGNLPPRTCETPCGMLNSIGLENPGVAKFITEKLPILAKTGAPVIVSIASEKDPAEFVALAKQLDKLKEVDAIELNISCPNIGHRSLALGHRKTLSPNTYHLTPKLISQDPKATHNLVKAVRKITKKTIITKLSPNVTDIVPIALAAQAAGSDAVSLINTLTGMSIDIEERKPKIAMMTGGLSGPAVRPVAVRMVYEVYKRIKIPIIGMGGIIDTSSALEFFLAGATAVAVGTGNFIQPGLTQEIILGIKDYLQKNKISGINKLIGNIKE